MFQDYHDTCPFLVRVSCSLRISATHGCQLSRKGDDQPKGSLHDLTHARGAVVDVA